MNIRKAIGYSFGGAIVASFAALLLGALLFGFDLAEWTEWEGRIIGMIGTAAGVVGAVVGVKLALAAERRSEMTE